MPNTNQQRVIDPILSNVALGYTNQEHVGLHLAPRVPVAVSGGKVLEFDKSAFKLYNTARAPGTATKRIKFGHEGKSYALENHALEAVVPREHQRDANQVPGVDLAGRAVNGVMRVESLVLEHQIASIARDANNYGAANKIALSGNSKFSDDTSRPSATIKAGREAIRRQVGLYPNTMIISANAFAALEDHPLIVDRIKHTSSDSVTTDLLARLFKVAHVHIGAAIAFDDDNGQSIDVWGNDIVLAYVPPSTSGAEEPSFMYTYMMDGHPAVEAPYWDNSSKSWVYGTSYERAPVLTGMSAGYLIKDAV